MPELVLGGCRPEPLALYLQALGVLRIVASQADPRATGHWARESFVLSSTFDRDELLDFFCDDYSPTPVVSPWNKDAGFVGAGKAGAAEAVRRIETADLPRFADYAATISVARDIFEIADSHRLEKAKIVELCRASLPDRALDWIDAAIVLSDDGAKFPPMLGTGGNDGRLDFSRTFLERVADVLTLRSGKGAPDRVASRSWAAGALFGEPVRLAKDTVGQFDPGAAGGPNSDSTGSAENLVNPWTFVLLVEGTMAFPAGVARRLTAQTGAKAAIPFTFVATAAGYSTPADEGSRGEMWLPLWSRPACYAELLAVFCEGRIEWNGKQASRALDAARGTRALGAARGIEAFVRYGFHERNGRATAAVPLGRLTTRQAPTVELTGQLDRWLDNARRGRAPAGIVSSIQLVERRLTEHAVRPDRSSLHRVLLAVARSERLVARSPRFRNDARVPPVFGLDWAEWTAALDDGSIEFDLARSLAGASDRSGSSLREMLTDVAPRGNGFVFSNVSKRVHGLGLRPLDQLLADVFVVRARAVQGPVFARQPRTRASSISAWLDGLVDVGRVSETLEALIVLDAPSDMVATALSPAEAMTALAPSYAVLAPCFGSIAEGLRPEAAWARQLAIDNVAEVLRSAFGRYRAAGLVLALRSADVIASAGPAGPCLAASLLLGTERGLKRRLLKLVTTGAPDLDREEST